MPEIFDQAKSLILRSAALWGAHYLAGKYYPEGITGAYIEGLYREGYSLMPLIDEVQRSEILTGLAKTLMLKEGVVSRGQRQLLDDYVKFFLKNPSLKRSKKGNPPPPYDQEMYRFGSPEPYESGLLKPFTPVAFIFFEANFGLHGLGSEDARRYMLYITNPDNWVGMNVGSRAKLEDLILVQSRWLPKESGQPETNIVEAEMSESAEEMPNARDFEWEDIRIRRLRGRQRFSE